MPSLFCELGFPCRHQGATHVTIAVIIMAPPACAGIGHAPNEAWPGQRGTSVCLVDHSHREFLIYELMKLRIFDTETNQIQSRIYYNPANVCIMPENINISEIDS